MTEETLPPWDRALMQHALFGLLTALFALTRPYLALDCRVQCSSHEMGLSATVRADNRHRGCWLNLRR
jgi:hypothetical protein